MKNPRNYSGKKLIKDLEKLGYEITRQKGSHVRLTTTQAGTHHVTIPAHDPIKIGTLSSILNSVSTHFNISREELLEKMQGS